MTRYRHPLARAILSEPDEQKIDETRKRVDPEAFGEELREQANRMGARLADLKARSARIEGNWWRQLLADVRRLVKQTEQLTVLLKGYQERPAEVDISGIEEKLTKVLAAAAAPAPPREPNMLDGPLTLKVTSRDSNGDIETVDVAPQGEMLH